ncbi:autotransporter-associated beta strand repeat-containing protein [Luteolibacter yonseiensis]|uniref:Autotransporter-associated beta strand repeat-containing protein n=1 Tax=Luteolibacter yonseiensis TaxID=1144680 RepID=A0A934R5G5_9BACT|nr:autotransporter-associated beta strand repeat-containing protein [Luteolibacter yonseiensis]MBK1816328.1 autotransporter-associated beta strand repeat-containing protein [Luteolibacter yonseiensis]
MKPKKALLGIFVICQFSTPVSQAATLLWDQNGTGNTIGLDGAGTWTTANNFHNGTANVTWPTSTATTDIAAFGNIGSTPLVGNAGTIDWAAGTTIGVGGLLFNPYYGNAARYNIRGNTATSLLQLNGTPTITVNTAWTRPFASIDAVMTGTAGFDVLSSTGGILAIGTQANTITGGIRLRNGSSFSIASDSALGGAGSGLTFSDASATLITRTTSTIAAGRAITISPGNAARFDSIQGVTLTVAPTGGITGAGSSLRKEGLGGLTLGGANGYTGQTSIRQGTLTLDFVNAASPASNIVNPSSTLRLHGGTLVSAGKAAVNASQTFAGTILDPGASGINTTLGASGTVVTNLGTITRNPGATLSISSIVAGSSYTAGNANTNGILGGYASVAGTDWVTVSGGNLVPYTGYQTGTDATAWGATDNVTAAATPTTVLAADSTINSLRFTAATNIAVPGGNSLTLASGGLLTTGAGASSISGGTLKGEAGGGLTVIHGGSDPLTISSVIADNGGASPLVKSGAGLLNLTGANTFSGNVFLNAGSLGVDSDAALGAGTTVTSRPNTTINFAGTSAIATAKNFVFDMGSDSWGGTGLVGTATDSGNANLNITNPAGVTISGGLNLSSGTFVKKGPGMLTLTNPGINQLARVNGAQAVHVQDGAITFNGGPASEWRVGQGEFHIGTGDTATAASAKEASVYVQSGLISVGSWTGVSRGNGNANHQSKLVMSGGTWDTGNVSLGFNNGYGGQITRPLIDLSGNATFIVRDEVRAAESAGSDATVNLADTSQFRVKNTIRMGYGANMKTTFNLTGSSVLSTGANVALGNTAGGTGIFNLGGNSTTTVGSYIGIGATGIGVANVQDNATFTVATDFNVGDVDGSKGTLNISGGTVNATNFFIGKGSNATTVLNTNGVINQSGGTLTIGGTVDARIGGNLVNDSEVYGAVNLSGGSLNAGPKNFQVGLYGKGVFDISGTGSFTSTNLYPSVARQAGSVGLFNMSGGTYTHTTTGAGFTTIGELGSAVLNVSGGTMTFGGVDGGTAGLRVALSTGSSGAANFNGGIVNARAMTGGAGTSSIYLNGAQFNAMANRTDFLQGFGSAIVGPGGVKINTAGFNVTAAQAMGKASGNGVTGIAVATGGTGYMAQPIVQITGGGGTGATAVANMSGGAVTGFTITNPGSGYTSAPTVTLLNGGSTTAATAGAVTTGAVSADGGLEKTGAGTLTLSGASTYSGPTNVTAGTLALGGLNALPAASALTLTGADLNMIGSSTAGAVVVNGGSILGNGQLTGASYTINNTGNATISAQLLGSGVNLTKTGPGKLTFSGSGLYTGLTKLSGGTTSFGATGSLDPGSSLEVGNATLDLRNGLSSGAVNISNLTLNNATIVLDMTGNSNDILRSTGTASISGTNVIKINGSAQNGPHTVIEGSAPLTGTYILDTTGMVTGFTTYTGVVSGNNYNVMASGAATPDDPYWKGGVSSNWTDASASPTSNWVTSTGANIPQIPGASSNVHFSATSPSNTGTTLNSNLSINSLSFETGAASLTGATNVLTILGTNANLNSLEVASGVSAGMNINSVYAGPTSIHTGGTLTVSGGSLGDANAQLLLNGKLNVNANVTKGGLADTDPLTDNEPVSGTFDKTNTGDSTITVGDTNDVIFSGVIKNTAGNLTFAKAGSGKMTLTGTNNTFTGALKIVNGTLEIPSLAALQSPSALIQNPGSTFINNAGDMTISYPYTLDLNGGVAAGVSQAPGTGNATYNLDLVSGTTTVSGLITNSGGSFAKRGAGTLLITNPGANVIGNTTGIGLAVQDGSMVLNGGATATYSSGEVAVGDVTATAANLTLTSGTLNVGSYLSASRANGTTGLTSTINLNGGNLNAQYLYCGYSNNLLGYNANSVINLNGTTVNLTGGVRIGESGGSNGVLNLNTGSLTNTGPFQIGHNGRGVANVNMPITVGSVQIGSAGDGSGGAADGIGAIYNNKAMTVTAGASTANFAIGNAGNAYGYYRSNPGASVTAQEIGIGGEGGNTATNGGGVLDMNAGSVTAAAWITPNRGGAGQTCLLNIEGGTLTTPNSGQFRVNMPVANQYALLNVSGTGSIVGAGANSTMNLNNSSLADSQGLLTIGTGGTVQLSGISASGVGGTAIVNFNGGTLKAAGASPSLLGTGLTGVYLNGGGAIIDTNTFDAGITPPLAAPLSVGVKTIALSTPGAGYIGRPMVRIIGDGVGATAVADFDPATGAVSGITVTNPGSGYNTAPTVTLIGGGGTTAAVVGTVVMDVVSTSGGLVKNGTGTLTLNGLNTYTGNTTVNAGGIALADNAQLLFKIGANGVSNTVTGTGTATFSGDFEIDTSAAVVANGNSWTLVNAASLNESFTASFTVNGFTESSNVWTKVAGPNTWTFSEATGVLSVSVGAAGYGSWASGYGLGANSEQGDPDNDGIRNLMEYVLGGIPSGAGAANTSVLPTQSLNATNLVLTFHRSDLSEGDVTVKAQWSNDMVNWTDFATIGATSSLPAVQVTEDTPSASLDEVIVTIPRAGREANGKLFGRVKASK